MKFKDVIVFCYPIFLYFITSLSSRMVLHIKYATCEGLGPTAHRTFSGGSREGSIETKLFHFHGEFSEKSEKMNK